MSERMAAEIWIGGKVPASIVPELCGEIDAAGVALDWGDGPFSPKTAEDLLDTRTNHDGALVLWLCDDQAAWGCFAGLEAFLQENHIPFTRRHDGGAVYDAELIEYHPGSDTVWLLTNSSGEPIVAVSSLMLVDAALARALEHLDNDRPTDAAKSLKEALAMLRRQLPPATPPLEPFEIDNER